MEAKADKSDLQLAAGKYAVRRRRTTPYIATFRTLNKKVRALRLPFPVYGKGVGDGSRSADAKL